MAAGIGYSLDTVDALSGFRAVYVGLWLPTAVFLLIALRRIHEPGRVDGRLRESFPERW